MLQKLQQIPDKLHRHDSNYSPPVRKKNIDNAQNFPVRSDGCSHAGSQGFRNLKQTGEKDLGRLQYNTGLISA